MEIKMESEFQKGYKKALAELKEKFKDDTYYTKDYVNEAFKSLTEEHKKTVKPTIYFTRLNKKGELEADWETTHYYAEHPEEFATAQEPKQLEIPELVLVDKNNENFKKIMGDLVGKKTPEMCAAENKLMFQGIDNIVSKVDPKHLNAIGQQIIFLTENPATSIALSKLFNVNLSQASAMTQVIDTLVKSESLIQFKDAM